MSEWLDLMLEEIKRKQREAAEAKNELARREESDEELDDASDDQS